MMRVEELIWQGIAAGVTDIHIQEGQRPRWRQTLALVPCGDGIVSAEEIDGWLASSGICWPADTVLSTAISLGEDMRLRLHGNLSYKGRQLALRLLYPLRDITDDGDADLWPCLAMLSGGFIFVTGATGSGKTTTLWQILRWANAQRPCHILTLEDPIEYVVPSDKAFISQREYGRHFHAFASAVKESLRQDPDIILVGEMRDAETMEAALTAAETGHLVLATLHTRSAAQAISRFVGAFPGGRQGEIRQRLSFVLQGIIAQERVWQDGRHRIYREILRQTPAVSQLIRTGKDEQLETVMQTGRAVGMRTMAQARQGWR